MTEIYVKPKTCVISSTPRGAGENAKPLANPTALGGEVAGGGRLTLGGAASMVYGLAAYAGFLAAFLYAMGFVGNWFVPKSIDTGTPGELLPSLAINGVLLVLFVLQHTIMARPAFKRWWTQIVPKAVERSTYVIAASACLGLMYWQWRPLPQVVWAVTSPALKIALTALSLAGWGIVLLSSFMVSHWDLFGLRQVWLRFRERAYRPVGFRLVGLYKLVRHPLMVGFLIAFWATPVMSVGHLFFAIMVTGYIFFGTWVEERDLIAEHGEDYLKYRRSVRGFVPLPKGAGA